MFYPSLAHQNGEIKSRIALSIVDGHFVPMVGEGALVLQWLVASGGPFQK